MGTGQLYPPKLELKVNFFFPPVYLNCNHAFFKERGNRRTVSFFSALFSVITHLCATLSVL